MKRITHCLCIFAISLAALTWAPTAAKSSSGANPGQSNAFGKPLAEWMKLYFTWSFGGPQAGQEKNVTFLPIPAGEPSDADPTVFVGEQDVALRNGQAFALPIFTFYGETYLPLLNLPDDDPDFPGEEIFTGAEVLIRLDGKVIIDSRRDDLRQFYFDAQFFDEPIFYDEPSSYGSIGALWAKGIGFVHPPLSPGMHRLELFVYNHVDFGFGHFGYANTWNITVGKK
jgi:hypothetical protein